MTHLTFDLEAVCFKYHMDDGSCIRVEGVCQAWVAVPRECHDINNIPFLPYKPEASSSSSDSLPSKTYRMSCHRCLLEKREDLCTHTLEERSFPSVYTLCELAFAASLGYQILEMDEAHIYTQQKQIFSSFF